MARNTVHCNLCGKAFFPSSLPIHMKSCRKKMAQVLVPCQYCSEEWPAGAMQEHLSKCREAIREQKRLEQRLPGGGRRQKKGGGRVVTFGNGGGGDDYGGGGRIEEVRKIGLGRASTTSRRVVGYGGGKAFSTQGTGRVIGSSSSSNSGFGQGNEDGGYDDGAAAAAAAGAEFTLWFIRIP